MGAFVPPAANAVKEKPRGAPGLGPGGSVGEGGPFVSKGGSPSPELGAAPDVPERVTAVKEEPGDAIEVGACGTGLRRRRCR